MPENYSLPQIPLSSTATEFATLVSNDPNASKIDYVRLTWVDFANNPRCQILPWKSYAKLFRSSRPGVRLHKVTLGFVGGRAAEGFKSVGNWLFVVDTNSMRIFPTEERVATVFGWFQEENPRPNQQLASPLCPRYILHRALQYAREIAGIECLVGVETEFILLDSAKSITAVNGYSWCDTLALQSGTVETKVLRDIADNLERAGIDLEMYHAEAAPGQYEVVTGPLSPLEAADALVTTREIIRNTASKHGLHATLSPRVYAEAPGSASHTHISVQAVGNRAKELREITSAATTKLSRLEASFLESLLQHLPAIQALSLPLPASYLRVTDGIWSGGTYVAWGTDNKEAPVRLVDSHKPESKRFEIKCIDGLSNPYLVLASVIAAGAKGVVDEATLSIQDLSMDSAAVITVDERVALGIKERMSLNVDEARQRFAVDKVFGEILGNEFVDTYLRVNETLKSWTDGDEYTSRRLYVEHW